MTDRPIIFSAPMIRALIREAEQPGTGKTQTRRLLTRRNVTVLGDRWGKHAPWSGLRFDEATVRERSPISGMPDPNLAVPFCHPEDEPEPSCECGIYRVRPDYEVGDRLWVKEAAGRRPASFLGIEATNGVEEAFYSADAADVLDPHLFNLCPWWRGATLSPIFMPRQRSRLTLHVTEVRVERLQDISEADAEAEGCEHDIWDQALAVRDYRRPDAWFQMWGEGCGGEFVDFERIFRASYRTLWHSLHGPDAWDANPWVVAITFRPVLANIDTSSALLSPDPVSTDQGARDDGAPLGKPMHGKN